MGGIEPYVRGKNDYARGLSRVDNPYEDEMYGTTEWESWFEGWDAAETEHLSERAAVVPPKGPPSA